jgi:hypothetical protein
MTDMAHNEPLRRGLALAARAQGARFTPEARRNALETLYRDILERKGLL